MHNVRCGGDLYHAMQRHISTLGMPSGTLSHFRTATLASALLDNDDIQTNGFLTCAALRLDLLNQRCPYTCCFAAQRGAVPVASRELDGVLFAGHRSFEWLHWVFNAIFSAQVIARHLATSPHYAATRF